MNAFFQKLWNSPQWVVGTLFGLYALLLVILVPQYGVSWDEPSERHYGHTAWNYILNGDTALFQHPNKFYGPFLPLLMTGIERAFGMTDLQSIFLMRHSINAFLMFLGAVGFFLLMLEAFGAWRWAALGALMWILSPRQFAEGFYNLKDIPFMCAMVWGLWGLIKLTQGPRLRWVLLQALICTIATQIRILGLILPLLTVVSVFISSFTTSSVKHCLMQLLKAFGWMLLFILLYIGLVFIGWPTLWIYPVDQFLDALKQAGHYPWVGDVLFNGKMISSTALPWFYHVVWIGITVPIVYLITALVGVGVALKQKFFLVKETKHLVSVLWFLLIGFVFANILLTKPIFYDGWRHLYFLYPAILFFSLYCLHFLWQRFDTFRLVYLIVTVVSLGMIATVMIVQHPYQNVFFNKFSGNPLTLKDRFELDYWGLSYRKALEYLLSIDNGSRIVLYVANYPGIANTYLLPQSARKRLVFTDNPAQARYFITNFRWHPDDYPFPEIFTIQVSDVKILSLYELHVPSQN